MPTLYLGSWEHPSDGASLSGRWTLLLSKEEEIVEAAQGGPCRWIWGKPSMCVFNFSSRNNFYPLPPLERLLDPSAVGFEGYCNILPGSHAFVIMLLILNVLETLPPLLLSNFCSASSQIKPLLQHSVHFTNHRWFPSLLEAFFQCKWTLFL